MKRAVNAAASASMAAIGLFSTPAWAQTAGDDPALLSRPLTLVVAFALIGLLPIAFMTLTSFLKISTVLQITRSAIGAQDVPSNTVVLALAGALSLVAMAPVGSRIVDRTAPLLEADRAADVRQLVVDVFDGVGEPLRAFLSANASEQEKRRFLQLALETRAEPERQAVTANDFTIVIPAFMVTELVEAFALGFAIFLPFVVIDLVIANVLLVLGMQTLNVTQVSLPFKLLLFVAADGWGLLSEALIAGYLTG
jgi:type III secretion protein R